MIERDVIVVGGGPAGLNAALILGRARRGVLICDEGRPLNAVASQMHGFLSRDGTSPSKLLGIGRTELQAYPSVEIKAARVDHVQTIRGGFSVTLATGEQYSAKRILLANGVCDTLPDIKNMTEFWGRSVFVCPFCDGWEIRDRRIVTYGRAAEAVDLAQELYGWSNRITVCSENDPKSVTSKQTRWLAATGCPIIAGPIKRLVGDSNGTLTALELDLGERIECDALFLTAPLRQTCRIAASLRCRLDTTGTVVVDNNGQTNVEGCYAAGDAAARVHQVILAAASGSNAAIAISKDLLRAEADTVASGSVN